MRDIRGIIAASFGYTAAIVGAGFASGQEIVSFFVSHGKFGVLGIVLACAAFTLFSYAIFFECLSNGIYSYAELIGHIFPNRVMRGFVGLTVFLCSAASLCVMTACAAEIGAMAGLPLAAGSLVFILLCGAVIFLDGRKAMDVNSLIGMILIAGITFTCLYILRFREHQTFSASISAAVSGASYAGYNLAGTGAVLAEMSRRIRRRTDAALSSLASGAIIFIMVSLIYLVLCIYYEKINFGEIPMLTMALRQNRYLGIFYTFMLSAAVLSTGISNGFALTDILSEKMGKRFAALAVLASVFFVSSAGFEYLVGNVYRIFGYAGAVVSVLIIIKIVILSEKSRNSEKNKENNAKYLKNKT